MKKIKLVITILVIITMFNSVALAKTFNDLDGHWAKEVIEKMSDKGVLNGFEDGTFKPNESVTREQFAKILVETLKLNQVSGETKYTDVEETRWSKKYIDIAKEYIINSKEENGEYTFYPTKPMTREEVVVAVCKSMNLDTKNISLEEKTEILKAFSDSSKMNETQKEYVTTAVKEKIMNGKDGYFDLEGNLTRAEVSKLMCNILEKREAEIQVIKPTKVLQLSDTIATILRYESESYKRPLWLRGLIDGSEGYAIDDDFSKFLKINGISKERINEEYESFWEEIGEKYCDLYDLGDGYSTGISYNATSTLEVKGYDYSVKNLDDDGLVTAWVEGVKGDGIGEKITLKMQQYGWSWPDNLGMVQTEDGWRLMTKEEFEKAQKDDNHYSYCYSGEKETTYEPRTYEEYKEYVRKFGWWGTYANVHEKSFTGWKNGLTGFYIVNGYAKNEKLFKANSRVKKLKLTIDGTKEYILELEDTMNPQLFDIRYEQEPNLDKLDAIKAEFEILEVYKGEKYEDTVITTLKGHSYTNMHMGG